MAGWLLESFVSQLDDELSGIRCVPLHGLQLHAAPEYVCTLPGSTGVNMKQLLDAVSWERWFGRAMWAS